MALIEVVDELTPTNRQFVEVRDTHIGKGLFAVRPYPAQAIIGEIRGQMMPSLNNGSSYAFEYNDGLMLEPSEPFRYVNHCCEPNCEFDLVEDPDVEDVPKDPARPNGRLYLIALRPIETGEQFSIDYNWSAAHAIRCECGAVKCRGWVAAEDEISKLVD